MYHRILRYTRATDDSVSVALGAASGEFSLLHFVGKVAHQFSIWEPCSANVLNNLFSTTLYVSC